MSTTIDERVVSMQFDNKHFEANVKTTMSTLDRLKQSLNLTGASKGLENVNAAAKSCNLSPIGSAIEGIKVKFSALEVMAVTALSNITNSAVNTGKQLVKSLTVDQLTTGWGKYDQKTASVQTLLNSTGKSIDEVNQYLNKLMRFSDETSYSFTDMTSALAQMTSSGGNIDNLIPLITGVANATAFAGKGAREFSSAMYNLNQSYSKGYLDYTDWKSIDLMGVSSKQLKQTIIDVAESIGTIEKGQVTIDNFASTLSDKWATREVLESAFGQFAEFSEAVLEAVDSGEYETASDAIAALSDKYAELGVKAFKSAQEAKTFTEAIDATKDAVSSGWMTTFEIIFGNYEEAKVLWTDLANMLWDVFASGAEARNELLRGALNSKWDTFVEQINDAGISTESFTKKLTETAKEVDNIDLDKLIEEHGSLAAVIKKGLVPAKTIVETLKKFAGVTETVTATTEDMNAKLEHFQNLVDKVWRGDFGAGVDRANALSKAGENYAVVQALVNRTVDQHRLTLEDLVAVQEELSDEQLMSIGYTEDQVEAIRDLAKQAEETGTPVRELIENLSKPSGRDLLIQAVQNILTSISNICGTIKAAWVEVFGEGMDSEQLYGIIESIEDFTDSLILGEDALDKIGRTAKGLFRVMSYSTTLTLELASAIIQTVSRILKLAGLDILTVTAKIGDAAVEVVDWLTRNTLLVDAFKQILGAIEEIAYGIRDCVTAFFELEGVKKFFAGFGNTAVTVITTVWGWITKAAVAVKNWVVSFWQLPIVQNILAGIGRAFSSLWTGTGQFISGFIERIREFIAGVKEMDSISFKDIGKILKNFWALVVGYFKNPDGIFGNFAKIFTNLWSTITNEFEKVGIKLGDVWEKIKEIFGHIKEAFFKNIGAILTVGILITLLFIIDKIKSAIELLVHPLRSFEKLTGGLANAFNGLATKMKADAIKSIATAIAILAGAVVALSLVPTDRLWPAVGAIAALIGAMTVFALVIGLVPNFKGADAKETMMSMAMVAGAFLMLALAAKIVGTLPDDAFDKAIVMFGMLTSMLVIMGAVSHFAKDATGFGKMMIMIGASLIIMSMAIKSLGKMDSAVLGQGIFALTYLMGIIAIMAIVTGLFGGSEVSDFGTMMIKISASLLLITLVIRMLGGMDPDKLLIGTLAITYLMGLLAGMMAATRMMGARVVDDFGKMMLGVAAALILMAIAIRMLGGMDKATLEQGGAAITQMMLVVAGMMAATRLLARETKTAKGTENTVMKAGGLLLAFGGSMILMAAAITLLSVLSEDQLKKATLTIAGIGAIMAGLIIATHWAGQVEAKTLTSLAVSLTILAVALAALSFIPVDKLAPATAALSAILMSFALVLKNSKDLKKGIPTLIVLTAITALFAYIIWQLSNNIEPEKALAASASLSLLLLSLAGALVIMNGFKKTKPNSLIGTAVALALVVYALADAIQAFRGMDPLQALGGAVSLSVLLLALAGALVIMNGFKKYKPEPLIVTAAALAVLAYVLAEVIQKFRGMDPTQAIGGAVALSILLGVLALAMIPLNYIGKSWAQAFLGVVAVAALAASLFILVDVLSSMQGIQNAKSSAMTLITILAALTLVLIPLTIIGVAWAQAFLGVTAVALLAASLFILVGVLAYMQDVKNAEANTRVLITLVAALTVILIPLTLIGALITPALLGVVAIAALMASLFIAIEVLRKMEGIDVAKDKVDTLITLIGALSLILLPLTLVGMFGPAAIAGVNSLIYLMGAIGAFALAVAWLSNNWDEFNEFLDVGLDILIRLASGIGEMLSAFVVGFSTQIINAMPGWGTKLTEFMENAQGFIDRVSAIDSKFLEGIGYLSGGIIALGVASFTEGLLALAGGGLALTGYKLGAFATAAEPFFTAMKDLDPTVMSSVATLAEMILTITASNVLDGIKSMFGLGSDGSGFDKFGEALTSFGGAMKSFLESISEMTDADIGRVQLAAQAGKEIGLMQDALPGAGGWKQKILGEQNLSDFSKGLKEFGGAIVAFANSVSDLTEGDVKKMGWATDAGAELAELEGNIPTKGGWADTILGSQNLLDFGAQLAGFGSSLVAYAASISCLTAGDVEKMGWAADAASELVELEGNLTGQGGLLQELIGVKSLGDFGPGLKVFGAGLVDYVTSISDLPDDAKSKVEATKPVLEAIVDVMDAIPSDNGWWGDIAGEVNIEAFGKGVQAVAGGISMYLDTIDGLNVESAKAKITESKALIEAMVESLKAVPEEYASVYALQGTQNISDIVTVFQNMVNLDTSGITTFTGAMTTLVNSDLITFITKMNEEGLPSAVTNFESVVTALKDTTTLSSSGAVSFKNAIDQLAESSIAAFVETFNTDITAINTLLEFIGNLVTTVTTSSSQLSDAFVTMAEEASYAIVGSETIWKNYVVCGSYLVDGLAAGITDNKDTAVAAAVAVADAVETAVRDVWIVQSPSKLFYKIASYAGMGLVNAFYDYEDKAYAAGSDIALSAKSGLTKALGKVYEILESDIDAQPTIRPVLDLSDVAAGARSIGGLFDSPRLAMANVGAINSMMNSRQNGVTNSDVVSAIKDLGSLLSGRTGDTYQISGVTYDDGSNITEAVKTLVRAARVERRI